MSTPQQKAAMRQINDKIKQVETGKNDAQKLIRGIEQLETCIKENEEMMKEMGVLEKATKEIEEGRLLVDPLVMDLHAKKYTVIKREFDALKKAVENNSSNAFKLSLKRLEDNLEKNALTTIPRSPLADRDLLIEKHSEFKEIFELFDDYNSRKDEIMKELDDKYNAQRAEKKITSNKPNIARSQGKMKTKYLQESVDLIEKYMEVWPILGFDFTDDLAQYKQELGISSTPTSQPKTEPPKAAEKSTPKATPAPQPKGPVKLADKPAAKLTNAQKTFQTSYNQKVKATESGVKSSSVTALEAFEELKKIVESSKDAIEELEMKDDVEETMKTLKQGVKDARTTLLQKKFVAAVKTKLESCRNAALSGDERPFLTNLATVETEMKKPLSNRVKVTIEEYKEDIIEKCPEEKANFELIDEYLTNKDSVLETIKKRFNCKNVEKKIQTVIKAAKVNNPDKATESLQELNKLLKDNEQLLKDSEIDHSSDVKEIEVNIENNHLAALEKRSVKLTKHIQTCVKAEEVDFNAKRLKDEFDAMVKELNIVASAKNYKETFLTKKDVLLERNPSFNEIYDKYDYYSANMDNILVNINKYNEAKKKSNLITKQKTNFLRYIEEEKWKDSKETLDLIKDAFNTIVELHKSTPDYTALENFMNEVKDTILNDIQQYVDDFDSVVSPIIEQKSVLSLKKYALLVRELLDEGRDDLVLPHSKVAELARFAYMYSLTFKDQTQQEVVNMKSMFDKVDQIITNNDYTIETIDLITSAVGCVDYLKTESYSHGNEKPYAFGMFCRLLKELKSKGIEVESLRNDMKTKAKNDFEAPDFNYEDKIYNLCEQNTSSFIKKAENKEFNAGNLLSSVKNYYQYINCDSSVHQKEFESYSLNDKFDWMTEASEEFNELFKEVKKAISSLDMNEDETFDDFTHLGSHSSPKSQTLHKFVLTFEDIMQTFEMIISTNGKKSFLQFPSLIKDYINVYNALLCIIAASMTLYIRYLMEIHETCGVYDAYNTNLVITLQNIVKTLRPFTEKFTSSTGLIHKHIEKALKPINDDIKQNLVMFKREEKTLQEIKEQIPKLLNANDLLSLSKALSLTTFIRTYYAYDKNALELMNEVDKQCISTSNFGFIPNLLVFLRDIDPIFNQTPKTDFSISPTIFRQKPPMPVDANLEDVGYSYIFNISVLLRNAFATHSYHKLCLHKCQEHEYAGIHLTSNLPVGTSGSYLMHLDTNSEYFSQHYSNRIYLASPKRNVSDELKYYVKIMPNAIKPLYYRALVGCILSVCPKEVPSEYTVDLILPLCEYNKNENGKSSKHDDYLREIDSATNKRVREINKQNFIAMKYHLGIEDEYNKQSDAILGAFRTKVAEYKALLEKQRLERIEKLYEANIKPYESTVLVHSGENYECTKTDKGFNIKVNNTSNTFLAQSNFEYIPSENGHYMVLFFNRGSCVQKDDVYKWIYRNRYAMDTDMNFGFSFDDVSKVPKELALILSHAFKMDKMIADIDARIAQEEREREHQRMLDEQRRENDRVLHKLKYGY